VNTLDSNEKRGQRRRCAAGRLLRVYGVSKIRLALQASAGVDANDAGANEPQAVRNRPYDR